jgi:rare lipoprotein A
LLLAACGGGRGPLYEEGDGPPLRPEVDVSRVPDAVPRNEPPSARGNNHYTALGQRYVPLKSARGYRERGIASWYGRKYHGRTASTGEPYDMYAMTAAHPVLPIPSYVRVRNLENGRAIVVRVNDRGPFRDNRIIDLSYAAAWRLGIIGAGTGLVEVETVFPDDPAPAPAQAAATAAARLLLQIGAFGERANAEALRRRLEADGFQPVFLAANEAGGARLYRVRLGPLSGVDEADRVSAELKRSGYAPIVVVE